MSLRPVTCAVAATILAASLLCSGCSSSRPAAPELTAKRYRARPLPAAVRAVWVARFHYRHPDDIRTIIRNCAADGFNTVLWQVRGNGTVAYRSQLEPWSEEYDHHDPGFDPLALAIEQAHQRGLRLEAWVNVMPGWRGPEPPRIRNQLWYTHPDWFLHDAEGRRQPLNKFYAILNPCLPAVRHHIASVVEEIVANYEVDGIHLDYVRYAWDTTPNARQRYPRDPETLRLYRQATGLAPDDDPARWDRWRAEQLTRLVREIRSRIKSRRPTCSLTAATWPSPKRGYDNYFQDALGWLRNGVLDAAYPMIYTTELADFERYMAEYTSGAPAARIVPGVGIYKHQTPRQMRRQLQRCFDWGGQYVLFSYASLHAAADDRGRDGKPAVTREQQRLRHMRLGVLREFVGTLPAGQ